MTPDAISPELAAVFRRLKLGRGWLGLVLVAAIPGWQARIVR